MTATIEGPTMMITLREITVTRLMALRASPCESLDSVVERISRMKRVEPPADPAHGIGVKQGPEGEGKYICEVLGTRLRATTLPLLFLEAVDLFYELAPEALDRLATERARKRRYVSRTKADIHPGRPDLAVIKTRSGWWVSGNVGSRDVARGLKALCLAASLEFGRDLQFSVA